MSGRRSFHNATIHGTASDAVQTLHENLLHSNDNLCSSIQDALDRYPAALMAPVTETVEQNGIIEELTSPNPTRLLLFRTLQRKLQEDLSFNNTSCYWGCLLRALQVARTLEGTKKHANGTFCDVPVSFMLQYGTKRLDVLWAFLQRHPDTCRAFANVLLFQKDIIENRVCESSQFLHRMHSETTLAASILTLAIQHWPLTLWLSQKGAFALRLVQGIDSALRVAYCCFQREKSREVLSLIQTLLRYIPWQEKLQSPFDDIIISLTDSLSDKEVRAIFLELCGGQVTPEGSETAMSPFIKVWMTSDRGIQWVTELLQLFQENRNRLEMNSLQPVLCSILTSNYVMFAYHDVLWHQFQDTLFALHGEKCGYDLMEATLKGRFSEDSCHRIIPSAWWDHILVGLAEDHSTAATACSCCGYMRAEDWARQENIDNILESISLICTDQGISAKWRTVSLKGLGNVCTNLFMDTNAMHIRQHKILQAVRTIMDDKNALVRCMALFVVGNLSFALRSSGASLQSIPLWINVSVQCLEKLQEDANEKVINNAIRSIGQIASLFLTQSDVEQLVPYVVKIVHALERRMQSCLPSNPNDLVLSWKQRSARKKHCWGSCNSIAVIFQCLSREVLDCGGVLNTLIKVLEQGDNEKVVVSACKAIRSYRFSLKVNLIPAIQTCVQTLEFPNTKARLNEEMELLMLVVLRNMTCTDFICWFSTLQDSKNRVLLWLFSWMVSHSVPSESFLVVSEAMNRSGVDVDVNVEQIFGSVIRKGCEEDGDEL
ncbi:hypothetical protein FisN_21Hh284 [Fistulifera solaris]|uniref:DUF4042 domain-containing protein n=1 Tax=Fistulifera solaris TaxID=1519565 RepID=A0A1Z5KNN3_FISSO|nr:hypothetical protein FisN_21Hh284 [Fistulifera solaris]|eukprot:GAX27934.1 hypothetical protein FisN_21Hh284 [Fistulifera solaris]